MTSKQLERAARAAFNASPIRFAEKWEGLDVGTKLYWRKLARDVLATQRKDGLIEQVDRIMRQRGGELSICIWDGRTVVAEHFDDGQGESAKGKTLRAALLKFVAAAKKKGNAK